ncbi:TetR/AcrR family transcriptional regulator [Nocardia sp. NEAU-G5]|uniref:TetR/AcrR family transcriptional regulator n=1 Tax=Nocardia albiluteola TaxID=2842303 RepID=A0ABS6AYC4_9NOCA|nr:TetR/AcrR family transcriptional regulator [Nocardia albiluteola]MBU3063048.1 TetR/AcrR family transcriptional regulator [Nocardia albiluteola]
MAGEDRRKRRSRKLLREAFLSLVLERGYAAITVEDITERADLGRATFYTHYSDKDALLDQIVTDLIEEMQRRLEPLFDVSAQPFTGKAVRELFRHAAEERDAYRVVLRGEGDGRALRRFVEDRSAAAAHTFAARAVANGSELRVDAEVLARAWVGQLLITLSWWLESESAMSADQVAAQLLDISLRGRFWASGFDGEPPARS